MRFILLCGLAVLSTLPVAHARYCSPPMNLGGEFMRQMDLESYQQCIAQQQQELMRQMQQQQRQLQQLQY